MRVLLFIFLIGLSGAVQAECKKKIDSSKVMLFIDVNDSDMEIDTAEKAACVRGQKLVIVPQNYKEYKKYTTNIAAAMKAVNECSAKDRKNLCETEMIKLEETYKESENFKNKNTPFKVQIKDALKKIRENKGTLENFTISGHDGGGMFGGNKTDIGREAILDIVKDFSDINDVKSVLLLGCYTGVPREIFNWQSVFPKVRMIGGYDGSAPLAFRPEGHTYLYDLLTNEKNLTTSADEKRLKTVIETKFKSIKFLNASMYLKPACQSLENEKSFYYGKKDKEAELREFSAGECVKEKEKISQAISILSKYNSGELEPPTDTTSGELRQIYNTARRFEHCREIDPSLAIDAKSAFGLLFFDGMKKNLSNFYNKDLQKANELLNELDQKKLDDFFNAKIKGFEKEEKDLTKAMNTINELEKKPSELVKTLEKELVEARENYDQLMAQPESKNLLVRFPRVVYGEFPSSPQDFDLANKLITGQYLLGVKKAELDRAKTNPGELVNDLQLNHKYKLQNLLRRKTEFEAQKLNISEVKKVWVPTKENMIDKSRKDILTNLHAISGLLRKAGLPKDVRAHLQWTQDVTSRHLTYFASPFSWHEFTGQIEAPPQFAKLDDYTSGKAFGGW